jgi:AraC-like DNA-binding protein
VELKLYDIDPVLQPFVKTICTMENRGGGSGLSRFRVLPDTCLELFVNYVETGPTQIGDRSVSGKTRSYIVARMNNYLDVHSPGAIGFVSVCFYPGKARQFFPIPMKETATSPLVLKDIMHDFSLSLEEAVAEADSNEERVKHLQDFLVNLLMKNSHPDKAVDYCVNQINYHRGQLSITSLAREAGISNRQLVRRFNEQIGISPKEFARVTKFIHSLHVLKSYPQMNLTQIAYESGYYDQAHFIHDYQEFAGYSPGTLLQASDTVY